MNLKKRSAFTLIEIMAASAIMSVVVLVVLMLTTEVLNTWSKASGQLQSFFDGGLAGSIMQEDLESAFMKRDEGVWFSVYYPKDAVGMLNGRNYLDSLPMRPPEIMFFSKTSMRPLWNYDAKQKQLIPGTLCAIKYQLAVKSPFMKSTGTREGDAAQYNAFYGLYRAVIDSKSTLTEFIPGVAARASLGNKIETLANYWDQERCTVLDENGNYMRGIELSTWALSPENLLTMNLVDFRVTFTVRYPNTDATATHDAPPYKIAYIPPGVTFALGKKLEFANARDRNSMYEILKSGKSFVSIMDEDLSRVTLVAADISMVFISEKGARELRALMRGKNLTEERFKEILGEESSKAISKRIEFIAEPQD